MIRASLVIVALAAPAGARARPATLYVGAPHTPSVVYGPADMLCDLNTCRLFNLPTESGLPRNAIVQFGLPQLSGQDRVDIRRCLKVCRATVRGYETEQKPTTGPRNPTVTITPIEMRLE